MGKLKDWDLAIIDGKYLCWRSFHAHSMLSADVYGKRVETGLAYGFMQTLSMVLRGYPPKKLAIAWDSRKSRRKKIFPGYKGNRKKDTEQHLIFEAQLDVLKDILKHTPWAEYLTPWEEADDIIASLVRQTPGRKLIVGSDHDLFQLINKDTQMLLLRKNMEEIMTRKKFKEQWGISASKFWQVMALTGDSGDCVPGLYGVGPVGAVKALKQWPSLVKNIVGSSDIYTLPEGSEEFLTARGKKAERTLDEAIETIRLSRKLTRLNTKIKLKVREKKVSKRKFYDALAKYSFNSMLAGNHREVFERSFRTKKKRS